jgi:FAD binding domain
MDHHRVRVGAGVPAERRHCLGGEPGQPGDEVFFRHFNEGVEALSPASRLFITQIGLEPLLRRSARERGAEHAYATELVSFEQDDDGVTAVLRPRDGGAEQTVRADYLVAADGAHSPVRKRCGIELAGRGAFADCVTIYFRADMRELIGDRNLSVVYVNHPELLGFFRFSITGDSGFLAVFSTINPDGTRNTAVGETMDTAWATELVAKALGRADIPVGIDNLQRWSAAAAHASRFRRYVLRVDPTLSRENLADPMDDASIELGPVYRSAGLVPEGGTTGPRWRTPAHRPGGWAYGPRTCRWRSTARLVRCTTPSAAASHCWPHRAAGGGWPPRRGPASRSAAR